MSSKVEICNLALSRLAAARIDSFDDNTIEAKECKAIYELVAKHVQSLGPWACNKFRVTLAQSTTTPDFGFAYQYQLPTNPLCLRVLKINEDKVGSITHQIENGVLLTDESVMSILYVGLVTDSQQYDVYLEQAIVANLIAQMAYKFTASLDAADRAEKLAEMKTNELLNLSSLQGSNDYLPSDTFTDIRYGDSGDNNSDPIVHQ